MPGGVPPEVVREREVKAWALRQRGWTEARIAAEIGVSQMGVSKILARLERRAYAQLSKRIARSKARQTLQLEHLLDEAVQAWERSKQPSSTVKKTRGAGCSRTEKTIKENVGDPAFLAQARAILAQLGAIWGMEPADQEVDLRAWIRDVNHDRNRTQQPGTPVQGGPEPGL
jgi:hypothetical protein